MMTVLRYPARAPWERCVVAVGNFDGVHDGHRALLDEARRWADEQELDLVVLTFWPHPRTVVRPDVPLKLLMTLDERIVSLGRAGADAVAVLDFDVALAAMGEADFRDQILSDWLGAAGVVVGENFKYGHKAAGDVAALRSDKKFATRAVPLLRDGGGEVLSSSRLR